jgi:hypothetical protein
MLAFFIWLKWLFFKSYSSLIMNIGDACTAVINIWYVQRSALQKWYLPEPQKSQLSYLWVAADTPK